METAHLAGMQFVDIVLGQDFCDVKVEEPDVTRLVDVERDYPHYVAALREQCRHRKDEGPEFTLNHGTLRFRVTAMNEERGPIWFLSRIDAHMLPIYQLPLPRDFVAYTLRPRLQGLLLITGGFGAGKTTAASSLFCHRIATLGGTGVALEDPTGEVCMAGRHGQGRIIQIPISRDRGGYHAALQLVRRSRADFILIGEIRDATTAIEAQDIANTDMPVIATMHASSIEETLDKYQAYLRGGHASSAEASARLAASVAGIVHLTKEYVRAPAGQAVARYVPRCLMLDRTDATCLGAIGKIRDGNFVGLNDDIDLQAARRARGT